MKMYKKILVAIDGSESSLYALRQSLKLAREAECLVTVVSVIPRYEGDLGATWINNVKDAIKKTCEKALSEAEKIAREEEVFIKTACEEGIIYERIVDLADAENSDLIVMGRKGMSGLERMLVGSITARVIGHSQRDVLVVPEEATLGWKNILLATDGSKYSEAATNRAIDFVKSYGGDLKTVFVVDIPPEFYSHIKALGTADDLIRSAKRYVETVKKKAEAKGVRTDTFVREGEASSVITDFAKEHNIDAIVIGSHGRTGLRRLLMGSVAERIIGHSTCPVLVVKL
jgi:nucleotide-binding universal stress UspA family protein